MKNDLDVRLSSAAEIPFHVGFDRYMVTRLPSLTTLWPLQKPGSGFNCGRSWWKYDFIKEMVGFALLNKT